MNKLEKTGWTRCQDDLPGRNKIVFVIHKGEWDEVSITKATFDPSQGWSDDIDGAYAWKYCDNTLETLFESCMKYFESELDECNCFNESEDD